MRGECLESVRGRVRQDGIPHYEQSGLHDPMEPLRDVLGSQAVRERGIYNAKVFWPIWIATGR